jgi:hypothetical protein
LRYWVYLVTASIETLRMYHKPSTEKNSLEGLLVPSWTECPSDPNQQCVGAGCRWSSMRPATTYAPVEGLAQDEPQFPANEVSAAVFETVPRSNLGPVASRIGVKTGIMVRSTAGDETRMPRQAVVRTVQPRWAPDYPGLQ